MIRRWFPALLLFTLICGASFAGRLSAAAAPGDKGILWSVDWSPDGRLFAVGGEWSRVFESKRFEMRPIRALEHSPRASKVRWHPAGKLLAVSGPDDVTAIYDITTDRKTMLPTAEGTRGIAWNATGERLATAGSDGSLQIWSAAGELLRTSKPENAKSLTGVAWHPKGDTVVTIGEFIRLYDGSGKLLREMKHRPGEKGMVLLLCVEWHPSGKFFVVGDYGNHDTGVSPALQFRSKEGQLLKTIEVKGDAIRNVSWSPDGAHLASASDALRIWSEDGLLQHLGTSPDPLWGVRWSPNGDLILTSSMQGRVTLWTPTATLARQVIEIKGPSPAR